MKSHLLFAVCCLSMAILAAVLTTDLDVRHTKHQSMTYPTGDVLGIPLSLENDVLVDRRKGQDSLIVPKATQPLLVQFHAEVGDALFDGTSSVMTTVRGIQADEMPPLDAGMVNVTADYSAYRMSIPINALGSIELSIPYDTALLPAGFAEEEIQTYCYDAQIGRWYTIPRDSVECDLKLVRSSAELSDAPKGEGGDGSLDFINAVIKTPEMPEATAYTPTSIKELEAANPLEGLTLMQPPTVNNSGTANLTYPIEIPAGRQGMQPNLALTYSSGGGNGWLGVGWDIPIPSITVETRWGVPRYSRNWESEVYVYEGEQLVTKDAAGNYRKLAHRTNDTASISRLNGNIRFYPRKDEVYDSIVRHGTGPDNYWWSVTHRNGVTDYYAKRKDTDLVDYRGTLCDPKNHRIAKWLLTESVDVNGNKVQYFYRTDISTTGYGVNKGTQIYIDSISYTCHDSLAAIYAVKFHYDDQRDDKITNAIYGFREVTNDKLCRIDIMDSVVFKRYFIVTENSRASQFKTRVTDIVRLDSDEGIDVSAFTQCNVILEKVVEDKSEFQRTHFDYYDYPTADSMFGDAISIGLENDHIQSSFRRDNVSATALGATRGSSFNVGGTLSVGVDNKDYAITSFNVGGNFSYGRSESEGLLTLIDINGDGMADKVFKQGGKLYYRPMVVSSGNSGIFYFGPKEEVKGASSFLNEVSHSPSLGLQGSIPCMAASAGVPGTVSNTTTYFADANGDGLPDIITDGGVLFNSLDSNNHPYFTSSNEIRTDPLTNGVDVNRMIVTSATAPCGGIIFDGEVTPDIYCSYIYDIDSILCNPDFVSNGLNRLLQDSTIVPIGFNSANNYYYFYRNTGTADSVDCNYHSLSEPDLDAVSVWVAPYTGTIAVKSDIVMLADSSESFQQSRYADGVKYSVEWNKSCRVDSISSILCDSGTIVLFEGILNATDTFPIDTKESIINVKKNDILFFRLQSKNDRSFDRVAWEQTITYRDNQYNHSFGKNAEKYSSSEDFVLTGKSFFQTPKRGTVFITGYVKGNPGEQNASLLVFRNTDTIANITLYAHTDNNRSIELQNIMNGGDSIIFKLGSPQNQNVDWGALEVRPYLRFIEDVSDPSLSLPDTLKCYPPVCYQIDYPDTSFEHIQLRKYFGPLYRGWGHFAYRNNHYMSAELPIDVAKLKLPPVYREGFGTLDSATLTDALDTSQFHLDTAHNTSTLSMELMSSAIDSIYNPLSDSSSWVEMTPDNEHYLWQGFSNTTSVGRCIISNTRLTQLIPVLDENDSFPHDMVATYEIPTYDHPVPTSVAGAPVQTIRKRNVSVLLDGSLSFIATDYDDPSNSSSLSAGNSISKGKNYIESDYLDLNGDRYPDVICRQAVQYTMPWGGIGKMHILNATNDTLCSSVTSSSGSTFSASYPMPKRQPGGNAQKAKINIEAFGGSQVFGTDGTVIMYLDVNGDGLPDRIDKKMSVSINRGYAFDPYEDWNVYVPRQGRSTNNSSSSGVGFSLEQESISGGVGHNSSENETSFMLMDFNGDGLPDMVEKLFNSPLTVWYNLGNGQWSSQYDVLAVNQIGRSISYSESNNGSLTLCFPVPPFVKIQAGIQLSPLNCSFSYDEAQLTDINGDGYPDFVVSNSESLMTIRYNTAGKTNLLKKVTNVTGSSIKLDYDMPVSCYEKPQRSWNLASVEVKNNVDTCPVGGNRTLTTFAYENPHYNRYERMDYGYGKVTSYQYDTDGGDTLYRYTVEEFNNYNFIKRGRKTRDCLYDALGRAYVEHLYDAIVLDFAGSEVSDDGCFKSDLYVGVESDLTNYYEGESNAQITTRIVKKFDSFRNITEYIYYGDTTHNEGWIKAEISYKQSPGHNLISLSDTIVVRDFFGNILQKRSAIYFQNGKLRTLKQYNGSDVSIYDFTYDVFGNISHAQLPKNLIGQRLMFKYEYDPMMRAYPIKVTNVSFGYFSTAAYDYRFGKPIETTDINGNVMRYEYDFLGRTIKVIAPYEQNNSDPFTIKMDYKPHNYGKKDIFHNGGNPYSYASTFHFDVQHPAEPITTTLICDGLGRLLQTKKDAEIGGNQVCLVTGKVLYDCFGRTLKQFHPFTEPLGTEEVYNDSVTSGTESVTEYDLMDRQTRVTIPGNRTTTFGYGFDIHSGHKYFSTTTTDPMNNTVTLLKGSLGQQIKTIAPMNTITTFDYSPLAQLLRSTDPDGLVTSYQYDMLGRLTMRTHPDAGIDRYTYDPAGNMVEHTNGNGQTIEYRYDYNHLTDIIYPDYPANNVHYTYGETGAVDNRAGRIAFQEDASGWQIFSYGKLGEVTENIRTFALPNESKPYTFKMAYNYDSFNRIQQMTYPDGEVVDYHYNLGGMLESIRGQMNTLSYNYISHISYNEFEMKDTVVYGNGSKTTYQYDTLQRLQRLISLTGLRDTMQNIIYQYDSVGNILDITNSAPALTNGLGGQYSSHYEYDSLYRLIGADGNWYGNPNTSYNVEMDYYSNGRVKTKTVSNTQTVNNHNFDKFINYVRDYDYSSGSNKLYRITGQNHTTQRFTWDGNGNMIQNTNIPNYTNGASLHLDTARTNNNRQYCWDEDNRLQGAVDNKYASYYQYDASGERTYKCTGKSTLQVLNGRYSYSAQLDNPTLYASPYVVCTPKGYTKHYYAESERVASRIGDRLINSICSSINTQADFNKHDEEGNPYLLSCSELGNDWASKIKKNNTQFSSVMGCLEAKSNVKKDMLSILYGMNFVVPPIAECYWYHPDHLGSSSWITFSNGEAVQHLHYLPWGEDFVDQRTTNWAARYSFSAKERDAETELSYFGARYYSSDLSIWLSVDPMSDKYPSTSPYAYCRNNPIVMVDPNGMFDDESEAIKVRNRAARRFGEKRVSEVFNNTIDGGKADYAFRIYGKGKSKYSRSGGTNEDGGPIITADQADKTVYSTADYKDYKKSHKNSYLEISLTATVGAQYGCKMDSPIGKIGIMGNVSSLDIISFTYTENPDKETFDYQLIDRSFIQSNSGFDFGPISYNYHTETSYEKTINTNHSLSLLHHEILNSNKAPKSFSVSGAVIIGFRLDVKKTRKQ